MRYNQMDKHTTAASYVTSACTAIAGGITMQDFTMLVGIATALGTFFVNWYYKYKDDKRQEKGRG